MTTHPIASKDFCLNEEIRCMIQAIMSEINISWKYLIIKAVTENLSQSFLLNKKSNFSQKLF